MSGSQQSSDDLPPLIVTAHFDAASFGVFDDLRRRHFPSHLNKVPAHLSLFHKLPGSEVSEVIQAIEAACSGQGPIELEPAGIRFLGRGVALAYQSPELTKLRDRLAAEWRAWLTPQDRQPFTAHITIQNKAEPATARSLRDNLVGVDFPPCRLDGVTVWQYLAGPWTHVRTVYFAASSTRS